MTWRELVHAICLQIPDDQFDDEAKICFGSEVHVAERLNLNKQDWHINNIDGTLVSQFHPFAGHIVLKQGEWTIE